MTASPASPRGNFLAIDFETADFEPDSACAVGLVKVSGRRVIRRQHFLIRPPRREVRFAHIHGLEWEDVSGEPTFKQLWPRIKPFFRGIDFIAAHNASFDRRVLNACCESARVKAPELPYVCTMVLARKAWNIFPTKLPDVCNRLGIDLKHHHALSDAEASAKIVIEARA